MIKKFTLVFSIIAAVLVLGGCENIVNRHLEPLTTDSEMQGENVSEEQQIIGGNRDEHGCLGPAGYSWDEEISACLRSWEFNEDQIKAAKIAVDFVGKEYGLTVVTVHIARCLGCFSVDLSDEENNSMTVVINNWEAEELVQKEE